MVIEPLGLGLFAQPSPGPPTARQTRFLTAMMDVLLYVVVLNLFVELVPAVLIESFTVSIVTAILFKLMLDGLVGLEHGVQRWFDAREGRAWRVVETVVLVAILFSSKFVILEITRLVFGDQVVLGGFVEVVVLIATLIAAREAVTVVYFRVLGSGEGAEPVVPGA